VVEHPYTLNEPAKYKDTRAVFVNSMSDTFHKDVSDEYIQRIFAVMRAQPWHPFQVLTKRSARLARLDPVLGWAPNIWMGVTVESSNYLWRIEHLRRTHAAIKFLSLEPLLGPLPNLNLDGISWCICGGESGPKLRESPRDIQLMDPDWCHDNNRLCLSEVRRSDASRP
jgi:protein gp37